MADSKRLVEKRQECDAKHKKLMKVFEEAGSDRDVSKIKSLTGDDAAKTNEIVKMNAELKALEAEVDGIVKMEAAGDEADVREKNIKVPEDRQKFPEAKDAPTDLGKAFVESATYKAFRGSGQGRSGTAEIGIPLKTVLTTTGYVPESLRTGIMVPYVRREPNILDIVPVGPTNQPAVVYMEETTRTNTAVELTESTGVLVDATLAWTERSATVQLVGVSLPVTSQALEDVDQLASVINLELASMLRERMDSQIINGTGVAPYLGGINTTAHAAVQTMVHAGEKLDTLYNALKNVRVTGRSTPNVIVMHPNDWAEIRLLKTDDGLYKMGNPTDRGLEQVWGVPVVQSTAITEGYALTGAFDTWCKLWEKRGILIEITDTHSTDFAYFKNMIRASTRVALTVTRPVAFCLVSGL